MLILKTFQPYICVVLFAFLEKFVCITSVGVLDEDMFRRLAATTVIDAMDSRGRNKVQIDDFGKPALACVMRAYGFELISGASACVLWHETYDWIFKTGYASEAAAWTLLVDVLRDRQRPADWISLHLSEGSLRPLARVKGSPKLVKNIRYLGIDLAYPDLNFRWIQWF